jgi:hypothetical protein
MAGLESAKKVVDLGANAAVIFTLVFIALQWLEMRSGSADTHNLAVAANAQADATKEPSGQYQGRCRSHQSAGGQYSEARHGCQHTSRRCPQCGGYGQGRTEPLCASRFM